MTTGAQQHSPTDLPLPEQEFVDSAYERLDALRASYRERQGRVIRPMVSARAGVDGARGSLGALG